ncbi:MAG: aspartate ammonia-lyase [Burkholderiaceae bacterium]|jgi:aspartate ammonia-lyase
MNSSEQKIRVEHDLLGERDIPAEAYWGIHTLRALDNYQISGTQISQLPELIKALACVKWAAAKANLDLQSLDAVHADVIVRACEEIIGGKFHDQFVVDVIQGGAGTSTNMNANEVIANRALELMGHGKGQYNFLHPIEHVNASQSTNDVYPTALKVGLVHAIVGLIGAMESLKLAFERKAAEFVNVLKLGRTQLQDAVPMTLGQEFSTFAVMLGEDVSRLREAISLIEEINLGATAIGTGINTDPDYAQRARQYLAEITGLPLKTAVDLIEATQDTGSFVQLSGVLKRVAVKLSKTCNDLRLLSSGPQAGLNEIRLPARAAGSSIMPGKVNPIIPEVVNQVAFEVVGNDITVTMASEAGQLQLNAFEPIMGWSLFKSIYHLTAACETLRVNCIEGIQANVELLERRVRESAGLATSLNPFIGYEQSSEIAKAAVATGRSVADLVLERGLLTEQQLSEILQPEVLTKPRRIRL